MKVSLSLILIHLILYNCSPINKQHGYLLEDVVNSADETSQFIEGTTKEIDIFKALGSPSIKISDVNNIWIYLISVKEQNIFESDDIVYQSIFRFEFDNKGILMSKYFTNEQAFTEIAFSKDKTRVVTDNYGIADQLYESFTRGQ
tara:strand:+ start:2539 stop:2973 length:435 start_codon:yes stop_codon:yes gene_type:complete